MKTLLQSILVLMACILVFIAVLWHTDHRMSLPPHQTNFNTRYFGEVVVAKPDKTVTGLSILFANSRQFALQELAKQVAAQGTAVAVIDSSKALRALSRSCQHFHDATAIAELMQQLAEWAEAQGYEKRIVAGIGDGALMAFLTSQNYSSKNTDYLSIDFSIKLPNNVKVCPPFSVDPQAHTLKFSPDEISGNHWRVVWTDQPPDETGIFVRSIPNADTVIAPYDTPLAQVAVDEINKLLGQTDSSAPPLPIVEVAATKPNSTMTLFYSGDGGWRDLDRSVAQEMAKAGYPVVGVDVLRYFWKQKSPEQAAFDLSTTLAYYRKTRGIKSFVLAGYSFGADILPAVFNRLPSTDKNSVKLLLLLAPGKQANFEIHVSGWLGEQSGDMPLAPELARIAPTKIMCIYGQEEKNQQGCKGLQNSAAELLELPGGHHFDKDYTKLAQRITDAYHRHALE